MKIPIATERIVDVPAMIFRQWLPEGEENGINITQDDLNLNLWFDRDCVFWQDQGPDPGWSNQVNVCAEKINADVTTMGVSDSLLEFTQLAADRRAYPEERVPLDLEYEQLGKRVFEFVMRGYNRLVEYAFAEKGQYWLVQYPVETGNMASCLNRFETKARVDGGAWFRWRPTTMMTMQVRLMEERRYIEENDWSEAQECIASCREASLPFVLIADAEHLAGRGHLRSALTEAVCALETAVFRFARNPKPERLRVRGTTASGGVTTLWGQVKRLRLKKTMSDLLPSALSEEEMPRTVLKRCKLAVQERNAVIHRGKTVIAAENLRLHLGAIRQACEILRALTRSDE